ncbi:MAG TPA: peptidoglycan DD-metalloendopeptidase family protein [Pedococcus sp.]
MVPLPSLAAPALALLLAAAAASPPSPPAVAPAVAGPPAGAARPQPPGGAVVGGAGPLPGAGVTPTRLRPAWSWAWPLSPRPTVLRPFVRPATRWGAGHRGVDLAGRPGQPVLAVGAGTVSHVGVVGGRGTVSVLHPSGIRSTYEPVEPSVRLGQLVAQGSTLGTLTASGSHCAPSPCLHLGALRGSDYLDPLVLLRGARVRLLPLRGAASGR